MIQAPHVLQNLSNQMLIADADSDTVHGNVKDAVTWFFFICLRKGCHPRDANDISPLILLDLLTRARLKAVGYLNQ